MIVDIIPSPSGKDVMLKIDDGWGSKVIVATNSELQGLKVAIEKYQEEQPMRSLKEGRGHE